MLWTAGQAPESTVAGCRRGVFTGASLPLRKAGTSGPKLHSMNACASPAAGRVDALCLIYGVKLQSECGSEGCAIRTSQIT